VPWSGQTATLVVAGVDSHTQTGLCGRVPISVATVSDAMETTITEHDGTMLARLEADDRVFEVRFDTIEPTDVTLRFIRDDERVGSIYNDDGTSRTMARLTTGRDGTDFIGVEVPTEFVADLLDATVEAGRVTDETALEGYRLRVL